MKSIIKIGLIAGSVYFLSPIIPIWGMVSVVVLIHLFIKETLTKSILFSGLTWGLLWSIMSLNLASDEGAQITEMVSGIMSLSSHILIIASGIIGFLLGASSGFAGFSLAHLKKKRHPYGS